MPDSHIPEALQPCAECGSEHLDYVETDAPETSFVVCDHCSAKFDLYCNNCGNPITYFTDTDSYPTIVDHTCDHSLDP